MTSETRTRQAPNLAVSARITRKVAFAVAGAAAASASAAVVLTSVDAGLWEASGDGISSSDFCIRREPSRATQQFKQTFPVGRDG